MEVAIWNDKYSVGSELLDGQHKTLFRLVNELHDAMMTGRTRNIMDATLDRLIRYTETHFKEEEREMAAGNFPGLAAHKKEHEDLTNKVKALQASFREGSVVIGLEVMNFLTTWLSHHILESDHKYAPYLKRPAA